MVNAFFIFHLRDKNNFCVASTNLFQSLKITNLHGSFGVELVCSQSHQFCWLYISSSRNNFTFSKSSFFGSTWKWILQIFTKLNIFDKYFLDLIKIKFTSTPHSSTYWSTCFSISSAIYCLFSNKSCRINCPQVFLRIAYVTSDMAILKFWTL
jgi:hypothetical protein